MYTYIIQQRFKYLWAATTTCVGLFNIRKLFEYEPVGGVCGLSDKREWA